MSTTAPAGGAAPVPTSADELIPPAQLPKTDCDRIMSEYLKCVQSKEGLSHVDDCSEYTPIYKTCIQLERLTKRK